VWSRGHANAANDTTQGVGWHSRPTAATRAQAAAALHRLVRESAGRTRYGVAGEAGCTQLAPWGEPANLSRVGRWRGLADEAATMSYGWVTQPATPTSEARQLVIITPQAIRVAPQAVEAPEGGRDDT
jgi:hypothetical protein